MKCKYTDTHMVDVKSAFILCIALAAASTATTRNTKTLTLHTHTCTDKKKKAIQHVLNTLFSPADKEIFFFLKHR